MAMSRPQQAHANPKKSKNPNKIEVLLNGGGARIRTLEGVSQQIYSLPSLTA